MADIIFKWIEDLRTQILYDEYRVWLKETLNLTPTETISGLNAVLELKQLRDECLGRHGETRLVKRMKKSGSYETREENWEKYKVLTFEEYKASKNK